MKPSQVINRIIHIHIAAPNNEHLMTLHHNLLSIHSTALGTDYLLTSQFTPSNYNYGQTASTAVRVSHSTVSPKLKQVFALSKRCSIVNFFLNKINDMMNHFR